MVFTDSFSEYYCYSSHLFTFWDIYINWDLYFQLSHLFQVTMKWFCLMHLLFMHHMLSLLWGMYRFINKLYQK